MDCQADAEDVYPRLPLLVPLLVPVSATPYQIPARRGGAPEATVTGCLCPRPALPLSSAKQQQVPEAAPVVLPYKAPQRRSTAEQAAVAEAARPVRSCPFPLLLAGPQLPSAPALPPTTSYLLALQG